MTIKSQLCISSSLQGTRQMTGRKYFNFWDIRSEANSSLHKAAQLALGKYLFFSDVISCIRSIHETETNLTKHVTSGITHYKCIHLEVKRGLGTCI